MTVDASVLGTLHSVDAEIDDLWGALTEPDRLVHRFGEVKGEVSQGGAFRVRIALSGERTGQVEGRLIGGPRTS